MPERKHSPKQPAELRVRGVRPIKENRSNCSSDSAANALIAEKLGCSRFPRREWCIQAERDAGACPGRSSADAASVTSACFTEKSAGPNQNDATGAPNSAASGLIPSPDPSGRAIWPSTILTGLAGS